MDRIEHMFLDLNLIYILKELNYKMICIIYPLDQQMYLMGMILHIVVLLDLQNNHLDKELCNYCWLALPIAAKGSQYIMQH